MSYIHSTIIRVRIERSVAGKNVDGNMCMPSVLFLYCLLELSLYCECGRSHLFRFRCALPRCFFFSIFFSVFFVFSIGFRHEHTVCAKAFDNRITVRLESIFTLQLDIFFLQNAQSKARALLFRSTASNNHRVYIEQRTYSLVVGLYIDSCCAGSMCVKAVVAAAFAIYVCVVLDFMCMCLHGLYFTC